MNPTPTQALLLFALLARHGACGQAELMPAVKKADREALAKAKLIGVGKAGRGLALTLSDDGWAWTAANLDAELPPAQRALADMLARLGEHLARHGGTLADVIGAKPEPGPTGKAEPPRKAAASPETTSPETTSPKTTSAKATSPKTTSAKTTSAKPKAPAKARAPTQAALRQRIEAAYLALTRGRKGEMVRLAPLRAELADLAPRTLDDALGRILAGDRQGKGKASLMRHDDPRQLARADHDAAFAPSGEPFHVLWIAS